MQGKGELRDREGLLFAENEEHCLSSLPWALAGLQDLHSPYFLLLALCILLYTLSKRVKMLEERSGAREAGICMFTRPGSSYKKEKETFTETIVSDLSLRLVILP